MQNATNKNGKAARKRSFSTFSEIQLSFGYVELVEWSWDLHTMKVVVMNIVMKFKALESFKFCADIWL